jgi:hypothetical protein
MTHTLTQGKELRLARLYTALVLSIIGTYGFGALFYADPFIFWEHALSELGTTVTLMGSPNLKAAVLVSLGMLTTALVLLKLANIHRQTPILHYHTPKSLLLFTASAGALIGIFPNNLYHFTHSIGSAMLIGSIYILELILIEENNQYIGPINPILLTSLISLLVVFYTAAFFFNTPAKQPSQKLCLISLLLVLYSCTRCKSASELRSNMFLIMILPSF